MSTNKHATIRYQTLNKCFRNPGKNYFIEDLIEACNEAIYEFSGISDGVKRRQVLDDIKFMESEQGWSIPLVRNRVGHRVFYRYNDIKFSINNQPLNETEEKQFKEALVTLSRFKGLPQFEWMEEIITRLDASINVSTDKNPIIEFEKNEFLIGLEYISIFYNAILYNKVLKVQYKSFKELKSQSIIFHTYYIKQYKNRWFVFGLNYEFNEISNLALDRIVNIKETKLDYKSNTSIDFTEYFEDVIGVTLPKNATLEKIELKVDVDLFPYIKTKPIHGSQKIKEKKESYVVIELKLIPNYELESLILSFGEAMTVLSPQVLREWLKNRIQKNLNNYF